MQNIKKMGYIYSFEKLEVWNNARDLAKAIYILSYKFSNTEKYGLASQIQRAAVSVSSNIAEGSGRISPKEKKRFIEIAYGSLMETLSQLFIAKDLDYISDDDIAEIRPLIEHISSQLSVWRNNIKDEEDKNSTPKTLETKR